MLKVYNVPAAVADPLESWVAGSKILWSYFNHTLGPNFSGKYEVEQNKYIVRDLPRLTHLFYPNSPNSEQDKKFVTPLIRWIQGNILPGYIPRRVMGNLTVQTNEASKFLNIPHVDSEDPNKFTFLYYVNNSDGRTVFFEDKKISFEVEPIKGTGVLFRSNTIHAGQIPEINNTRYVINIILGKRD